MSVHDESCEVLIERASQQLRLLREAIARHDLSRIESHTKAVQEMLTDLEPLLIGRPHPSGSLRPLREAIFNCAALINHMQLTARALSALYRSVSQDGMRN